MRRRSLLSLVGTAVAAGLAGCSGEDSPGTTDTRASETTVVGPPESTALAPATTADSPAPTPAEDPAISTTAKPSTTSQPWPAGPYADYETTTVRVLSPDGDQRGAVTAAVADDGDKRFLGLSDADSMPEDGGMLFVYGSVRERTFVMRRMDFGLDIVYADDTGTITTIHTAPAPGPNENGNEQAYPGTGQYVLELNDGWTDRYGVEVGDRLDFQL